MQQAAQPLVGTHDFVSFQTSGSSRLTTERTVFDVLVERRQAELTDRIVIEVEADGFLYNMVRNIAGTLVEVGKGKQPVTWPAEVLALRDRRLAGMTAPAAGAVFDRGGVRRHFRWQIADCRLQTAAGRRGGGVGIA